MFHSIIISFPLSLPLTHTDTFHLLVWKRNRVHHSANLWNAIVTYHFNMFRAYRRCGNQSTVKLLKHHKIDTIQFSISQKNLLRTNFSTVRARIDFRFCFLFFSHPIFACRHSMMNSENVFNFRWSTIEHNEFVNCSPFTLILLFGRMIEYCVPCEGRVNVYHNDVDTIGSRNCVVSIWHVSRTEHFPFHSNVEQMISLYLHN